MNNALKLFLSAALILTTVSAANAATYYWTVTDKASDGSFMNVRLIQTTSEFAPTSTNLGKDVSVSAGPFSTKGDARINCEKTVKAVRQNGQLAKNYCLQAEHGK